MLEKVVAPDRNAPNIPTIGETQAQTEPMELANKSTSATGIDCRPAEFAPEFKKIFTIGTDAPSEIMVGNIEPHETLCL